MEIKVTGGTHISSQHKFLPYVVVNRQGRREVCALDGKDAQGRPVAGTILGNVAQIWGTKKLEPTIAAMIQDFEKK